MTEILEILHALWTPNGATVAAVIGVVASLIGSVMASRFAFRFKSAGLPEETADLEESVRIREVKDAIDRQDGVARWSGRASALLLFSQVVIGGVLATSFAQTELDKKIVGLLGVLVLVSSLIHQQFRPDLKQRGARRRVVRLRQLLKDTEDTVFEIRKGVKAAPDVPVLRRRVSKALNEIEQSEVEELPGEHRVPRIADVGASGRSEPSDPPNGASEPAPQS